MGPSCSVSAERWIPLVEVPEPGLMAFLERRRGEGYALVGLEQTAHSLPIQDYAFPRKMVTRASLHSTCDGNCACSVCVCVCLFVCF